jgi:hydroxyethylthiazole kinase-like uncharacterized protein yjeF
MRVCTASQMAAIDRETIAQGVPGLELMERAGTLVAETVLGMLAEAAHEHGHDHGHDHHHGHGCGDGCGCGHGEDGDESGAQDEAARVLIVCGKGNNGGDGLVAARLLADEGVDVTVLLLAARNELSSDASANLARLPKAVEIVAPPAEAWAEAAGSLADESDLVVDAVFGTGITPPLRGAYPDVFRALNDAGRPCLAVDIPSGVDGDTGRVDPVAVAADRTLTIGLPKRGLLLPPGRDFTGEIEVADIGFADEVCDRHAGNEHLLARGDYLELLPPRRSSCHKYQCGTVLVAAGSRAFGGAAHLAGLGALRSGAGLVTLVVPEGIEIPVRVGLPEAIIAAVPETATGTIAPLPAESFSGLLGRCRAVALGPGLGEDEQTDRWVMDLLENLDRPCVVDADGLGAFARQGSAPRFAHDQVVLTPHAGELARLIGRTSAEVAAQAGPLAAELAARWNCVLMLKGSPSFIAAPDGRVFINASGDDALARGGSGDVLTGLVGGLLAQGLGALEAALLGAYIHGRAGTLAAEGRSTRSVLVREIAAAIGPVFEAMEKEASSDADLRERLWPTGDA